jgi:hypothetical protein
MFNKSIERLMPFGGLFWIGIDELVDDVIGNPV